MTLTLQGNGTLNGLTVLGAPVTTLANTGTAASPSLVFDGDSDTGLFRPGANQLAFSVGGSARLTISSDGTTTYTASIETTKARSNTGGSANCALLINPSDSTMFFGFRVNQSDNDLVIDSNSASDVIKFGPTGYASFASGNFDLASYGALSIKRTDGNNFPLLRWGTDTNYSGGGIYPNGSAIFANRVDVGGLTVDSNLTPTSGASIEAFYNNGGFIQAYDRGAPGFTSLRIKSSNYELGSDGSATFASNISANNGITVDGGSTLSTGIYYRDDSNSYGLALYSGGSAQTNRKVFIKTDGSATFAGAVDVGTFSAGTSGIRLTNTGTIYIGGTGNNAALNIGSSAAVIDYDGSAVFDGSVAIGTATANKKLHVRNDSDDYPVLVQNRTNAVSTCGIAFIATGSDFADGQYATIEALSGGTGSTQNELRFRTCQSGGTPTEKIRILATGGLTFNGDTAAANALDDYEEGTFTPAFNGTITYTGSLTGNYTKIGRVVYFSIGYSNQTFSGATGGVAKITGLPFTASSDSINRTAFYIGYNNTTTNASQGGYVEDGTTNIIFYNSGTVTTSTFSNGSSKYIYLSGFMNV